ncbi:MULTISPECIES: HlyD family secretion protein [unclassified Xanthobacter]|uniref:HlyD family secretion protein n=1 Tax=unclassified Xanthobacter TaxID=2623496 RepID=UPI001EE1110B|nr:MULTISPECIES: biotin/lipoyl-binding protein [unclassified Xanthobacter]
MMIGILICALACFVFWLVFLKLKLLRMTPGWVFAFSMVVLHLLLIFVIGLRFVTPYSTNATVVQHTIQLIPRLPEPTLVTEVLVKDNTQVKKGDPLFRFDTTIYAAKVQQLEAQLAAARQNVKVLQADIAAAEARAQQAEASLSYSQHQKQTFDVLAQQGAAREDDAIRWRDAEKKDAADFAAARAEADVARLKYDSTIDGVNTTVAALEAELRQARYYLDNTTLRAPEDGRIINLQVRPGMVAGILRVGAIAALIVEQERYVLATYFQENLKFVKPGQGVELAFNLYPGQIFTGRVETIWKANGQGQYLPNAEIPRFEPANPDVPQGQYGVKILVDGTDPERFPIGAQGAAAIYVNGQSGSWAALRKIAIRSRTWLAWLYPLNI